MAAAKLISIPDLLSISDPSQYGLLRVIGRLESYDIKNSIARIQDPQTPSSQVTIGTLNIEPFPSTLGALYQFIGEVNHRDIPDAGHCLVLAALACRCMDGLDMDIYMRAHRVRMKDLETPVISSALPKSDGTPLAITPVISPTETERVQLNVHSS